MTTLSFSRSEGMNRSTSPGWHWPVFPQVLCGTMTDRERLGLPDHYLADRLLYSLPEAMNRLRTMSSANLAALCEEPSCAMVDRLAAGQLLAWLGDPRIDPFHPTMVTIPAAEIEIGLPDIQVEPVMQAYRGLGLDRRWIEKECPRHRVSLRRYAIAKYPVTHAEYLYFLQDTQDSELPSSWDYRRFPLHLANHPVYTVSAAAADRYAQWLAQRTGRAFRLPTEAEWEYAAAGPEGWEFPWGNTFSADHANLLETGLFQSSPVGAFPSGDSPFGLSDMAGNVEEYVADRYAAYPGGRFISDHLVEIHGDYRIARGGSFARLRDLARTRRRHGHNPRSTTYAMGFRLAEDLPA
jgi:formylglycine-generating enzyme required for sulfatase activity